MLKKILTAAGALLPIFVVAQMTINVQLPPAGMIQKDQLWNLVLVNNNKGLVETSVSLDLKDAVTGQTILSGGTRSFMMGKGVKVINIRDVQPVLYNYQSSDFTGTFIPQGSYIACYRVFRMGDKGPEPLGDECVRLNINPLSPPLLATPANGTTLETEYPSFSWLPPTPANMFTNLTYDIVITEVAQGQQPSEAILYNTPIYTGHYLKAPYHVYPASFARLKRGQAYAWQVTARNAKNYAAQTEVWAFTVKESDSVKVAIPDAAYIELTKKGSATVSFISDNNLFVKYYSFDKEHAASIRFLSSGGDVIASETKTIVYGNNYLHFDLNNQFGKNEVYTIEINDLQNNIYKTRFSIK